MIDRHTVIESVGYIPVTWGDILVDLRRRRKSRIAERMDR